MDSDTDTTAIIEMKRSFHRFVNEEDSKKKRSRLDISHDASLLDASQASARKDPESIQLKTDLIYCKTRISMLETQLTHKDTEIKEQNILHEKELAELKRQHDRELRGYEVLKTSHERVLQRQLDCESELDDSKASLAHLKSVYETKISALQKKNLEQESLFNEMLDEQKAKCRELRNKVLALQADLSVSTIEAAQLKEQLSEAKRRLNDSQSSISESDEWKTRAEAAEERVKQLEKDIQHYNDDLIVMAARKQDLANLQKYKEEVKKLTGQVNYFRATTENIEVMKEKVQTMERKLESHNALQQKYSDLEVECESLKARVSDLQNSQVSQDTVQRLKEAQTKEVVMLSNIGELKSKNRTLEAKIQELENAGSGLKARISGTGDEMDRKTKEIDRLQRRICILTKERDGYKKIIDSYECDVTREIISHTADKSAQLQQTVNSYVKAYDELEKELQTRDAEIVSLKQKVFELESASVCHISTAFHDTSAADKVDLKLILQLREQVAELEKQCEILIQEKEVLEARIEQRNLQGDYDPTKTKVLHFTMNPTAVAQRTRAEELKKLTDDNRKLRERVKILENKLAEAHDLTAQVEANLKAPSALESQQLKETKAKLASTEHKMDKMMDMFKTASLEFRQVVYQLLGYRIDVPKSKQYKLMSMYAATPDDYLLFQDVDGELQLLETDFATTLTELAEEHLHNQASIPAFLSSLTLDLFKQQTMSVSMM